MSSTNRARHRIRRAFAGWAIALLALTAVSASAADAPPFVLETFDGTTVDYGDAQRHGPTIVMFWATWCPYCKALMPHLQSMLEEYEAEPALRVFAISYREDGDPRRYLERQGYTFTAFPEAPEVAEAYDVSGTPGLYVVSTVGRIELNLYQLSAEMRRDPQWASLSHGEKAARRAPRWAARIRETLDRLYAGR